MASYPPNIHNFIVGRDSTREDHINIFKNQVSKTLEDFKPEVLLISAGFDALATDPMNYGFGKLQPEDFKVCLVLCLVQWAMF